MLSVAIAICFAVITLGNELSKIRKILQKRFEYEVARDRKNGVNVPGQWEV
jgi:hypothetical protein